MANKRKASGQLTRNAKRRRRINAPGTVKSRVNKIMRFIKQNKPEVKYCKYTGGASFQDNTIQSWNLAYHMFSQGVGENQFIGKKLNLKYLTLKYYADNAAVHTTAGGGSGNIATKWRVLVVATKTYKTVTSLNAAEIFDQTFTDQQTWTPMYDSDKIKILAARTLTFSPHLVATNNNLSGPPMVRSGTINLRLNREFTFKDSGSSEAKLWNYYVLVHVDSQGLGGGNSSMNGLIKIGDFGFKAKVSYIDA